jgi:hypothetical protein
MLIPWSHEDTLEMLKFRENVLGSKSGEGVPVSWKLSTIEERRKEQICLFWREDYKNEGHKPKTVLGSSLGEDVGFRDNSVQFLILTY